VTALSLVRLVPEPAGQIVSGEILLEGDDLLKKSRAEMTKIRGKKICMILQDPTSSLNPVFSIGEQATEALQVADHMSSNSAREKAIELFKQVKIPAAELRMADYPHQMSGGMRQRVAGAIAISRMPKVLIADEPTTSLDATVQLQYLRLLKELQAETGMAIIFITHDFGVVARMCDRVAVMYAGKIVEIADVRQLFNEPAHPYTSALLGSLPDLQKEVEFLPAIEGQPPRPEDLPPGCSFGPRCRFVFDRCVEYPPEFTVAPGHKARCWKLDGNSSWSPRIE